MTIKQLEKLCRKYNSMVAGWVATMKDYMDGETDVLESAEALKYEIMNLEATIRDNAGALNYKIHENEYLAAGYDLRYVLLEVW